LTDRYMIRLLAERWKVSHSMLWQLPDELRLKQREKLIGHRLLRQLKEKNK
jgi:hypothetical protein